MYNSTSPSRSCYRPSSFAPATESKDFYGIQAINFQMVLSGNANRARRCASFLGQDGVNAAIKTATVDSFQNSRLLFQFITPHASDVLGPRNVVPYYEVPVFRTTGNLALPGRQGQGGKPPMQAPSPLQRSER